MSEQLPPVGDYFGLEKYDVLKNISGDQEFWETISCANTWLNSTPGGRSDDPKDIDGIPVDMSDPEEEALDLTQEALGFLPHGQPVRIIGHAYRYTPPDETTDNDATYIDAGTIAIERGEYCGPNSIHIQTPVYIESAETTESGSDTVVYQQGYSAVAFCVSVNDEIFAFPLSKKTLCTFEVWDKPDDESEDALPLFITDFQKIATVIRSRTHMQDFYESDPDYQVGLLSEYLEAMNDDDALGAFNQEPIIYRMGVKKYFEVRHENGAPVIINEQTSNQPMPVTGEFCEAIIPELMTNSWFQTPDDFPISEGEPMLALTTPATDKIVWIPLQDIVTFETNQISLVDTAHGKVDIPDGQDLLLALNRPNIFSWTQFQALEAETFTSSEELDERVLRLANEVDTLTGVDIDGQKIHFSGKLYTQQEDETYAARDVDKCVLYGATYDIRYIEGAWRFVVVVEYETDDIVKDNDGTEHPDTEIGYVIPQTPYCTELIVLARDYSCEYADNDLTEKFAWIAREARRLLYSREFSTSTLEQQLLMLDRSIAELDEIIQEYIPTEPNETVLCIAKGCMCIPLEYEGTFDSFELPYATAKNTTPEGIFTIEGNVIGHGYPEMNRERDTPYNTVTDFPVSNGEPMVMIENTTTGYAYLIRLGDVVQLRPTYAVEDSEQGE